MAKKGTYAIDLEKFKQFKKQLHDMEMRALDGQINLDQAPQILQVVSTDRLDQIQLLDLFARFSHLLLPLDEQLALLREYNEKYWGGALTEDMFAAVDTESDHAQRVEDLELLYVEFGSPKETFENWVAVWKGEQPGFWRGDSLSDGYKIRRLAKNTRKYPVGIHRIHINLAANWSPKQGRSVDDVRDWLKGDTRDKLAHGEVFAAYALHTELLQKTDGTNLPYFDAAGYEVKLSGDSEWRSVPYGYWSAVNSKAYVRSYSTDGRLQRYAAPVVRES